MTTSTHVIFATKQAADDAQQTVFERLQVLLSDIASGSDAWDVVLQYKEGYGFASPRTSNIYAEYADTLLAGFEDNEMNATLLVVD